MPKLNTTPEQRSALLAERDAMPETGGSHGVRAFEAAALAEDVETLLGALEEAHDFVEAYLRDGETSSAVREYMAEELREWKALLGQEGEV